MTLILKKPWVEGLSKIERFTLTRDTCTIGFQNYVKLDLLKPIEEQLKLRELIIRKHVQTPGDVHSIRSFVEKNSSLKIEFGFSFETDDMLEGVLNECLLEVAPKYNVAVGCIISDMRCDWFGFMPLNIFEQAAIEDLNLSELILYNNELIKFQQDVVTFVANHKLFRQHSVVRNDRYRFGYFKAFRHDEEALVDAFWFYMEAMKETSLVTAIPRDILEEHLGCHFLWHPDKFFELLEFIKLKGDLYE